MKCWRISGIAGQVVLYHCFNLQAIGIRAEKTLFSNSPESYWDKSFCINPIAIGLATVSDRRSFKALPALNRMR